MSDSIRFPHPDPTEERAEGPRFSLVMPTKDRPDRLRAAIDAVLSQDFESWELIIKDGGDASAVIPHDQRIIHLKGPERNLAHAINIALSHASGQIFSYACDDDVLCPGALSYVDANMGEAMWLRGQVELVDKINGGARIEGNSPFDLNRLKAENYVWQPGVFWKAEATTAIGLLDEFVPLAADYDYWIRLGLRWTPKTVDQVLARYTIHEGCTTLRSWDQMQREAQYLHARYGSGDEAQQQRIYDLEYRLAQAANERSDLELQLEHALDALAEIEGSGFWRATAPARWALNRLYGIRRRGPRS